MTKIKHFLFIAFLFSYPLFAEELISPQERYERAVFVLRQNGAFSKDGDETDHYPYLFRRTFHEKPDTTHNPNLSRQVGKKMKAHLASMTVLDETAFEYFDYGGTCSAMALDFLARYLHKCHDNQDPTFCLGKVKQFAPYYKANNTTFISRQAAYNAIRLKPGVHATQYDEDFKWDKMQTLARFHNIELVPATQSISRFEIADNPDRFKQTIDELPEGAYLVRALSPNDWNEKREWYGHSMVLIKGQQHAIYYDNADGAANITNRVSDYVLHKLGDWSIPECRLYFATPKGKIRNLSKEKWD